MIRKILVPLDGSPFAERALPQALAVARGFGAEVVLLRVQEADRRPGSLVDSVSWRLARAEAASYVSELAARLREQGMPAAGVLAEGDAAEEILAQIWELGADLVVLSARARGGSQGFSLGGVAHKVLSRAEISVLLVRVAEGAEPVSEIRYARILVPLDGSQRAQWALLQAVPLARAHGAEILLVHVVTTPSLAARTPPTPEEAELVRKLAERDRRVAKDYLREMADLMASNGLAVRTLLLGSPHVMRALQKVAADEAVSLMVLSAHGCSGAAPWPYGSVTERLIRHGTTPLFVLQDLSAREPVEAVEEGAAAGAVAVAS